MEGAGPDDGVVVDVVFEDGVLYLELANLADRPALNVSCAFDPPLVDAQGRIVSELKLFRHVELLGPRRQIRTLLDSVAGYFAREAATRVTVAVEYERPGEPRRTTKVAHDLELFRELAHLV
ncbi:MAG TPA: hypothetical protein VFL41_06865 [Gaiellaceae bacterium]|nr:hypothetical protein [Gaiellaceae bacterium]